MTTYCDWTDVEACARELAGNHREFDSFAWFERPSDADQWSVVYTHHRDSGLLDQSNAEFMERRLEPFIETGDVVSERHSHWAVGWIDGFAIRVFNEDGVITQAFQEYCVLQQWKSDYPVLDEEDYSRREYEAAIEAIKQEGCSLARDATRNWPEQVFSWLWEHNSRELENCDDQGACPSCEAVREALMDLDLLDATYLVRIGNDVFLETESWVKGGKEFGTLSYHASMGIGLGAGQRITLSCDEEIINTYPEE